MTITFNNVLPYSLREIVSLLSRLGEKIKDRYFWMHNDLREARSFLFYFRDTIKKDTSLAIFGENGIISSIKPFRRGYNAKSITFKTTIAGNEKKWVLKVGHRISPVIDYGDPSTKEYFHQLQSHLAILLKQTKKNAALAHLIPQPQEVLWGVLKQRDKVIQSTLMIQPFLTILDQRDIKNSISKKQAKHLLHELNAFKNLCTILIKQHKVRPDLMGEGNLSIAKIHEEFHLVLLDTGLLNMDAPLPLTHTVMHFASIQTVASLENALKELTV